MFIATLFTIAKIWKQPKCPSVDEWIKKLVVWGLTVAAEVGLEGGEKRGANCNNCNRINNNKNELLKNKKTENIITLFCIYIIEYYRAIKKENHTFCNSMDESV